MVNRGGSRYSVFVRGRDTMPDERLILIKCIST